MADLEKPQQATIMVISADMDKAIVAFLIATGYAAMGIKTKMWFTILGANCLKRRRSVFHVLFGRKKSTDSRFRRKETDSMLQTMVELLNQGGANHLPLSQINLFGLGPKIFNTLLKRKNIPTLEELIYLAEELEISFTICQICVDALGLDTSDLIVSKNLEVKGVAQYVKDSMGSIYNTVI
jgi:peroxiredoxin family protein